MSAAWSHSANTRPSSLVSMTSSSVSPRKTTGLSPHLSITNSDGVGRFIASGSRCAFGPSFRCAPRRRRPRWSTMFPLRQSWDSAPRCQLVAVYGELIDVRLLHEPEIAQPVPPLPLHIVCQALDRVSARRHRILADFQDRVRHLLEHLRRVAKRPSGTLTTRQTATFRPSPLDGTGIVRRSCCSAGRQTRLGRYCNRAETRCHAVRRSRFPLTASRRRPRCGRGSASCAAAATPPASSAPAPGTSHAQGSTRISQATRGRAPRPDAAS